MSIYWNNILIKRLRKLTKITGKYRVSTDIGQFYFYFQKDHEEKDLKMSVKIIFLPK
ncbi:MAG: hypothetical protein ACTSV5_00050 [Promethearchaeota archaeon]